MVCSCFTTTRNVALNRVSDWLGMMTVVWRLMIHSLQVIARAERHRKQRNTDVTWEGFDPRSSLMQIHRFIAMPSSSLSENMLRLLAYLKTLSQLQRLDYCVWRIRMHVDRPYPTSMYYTCICREKLVKIMTNLRQNSNPWNVHLPNVRLTFFFLKEHAWFSLDRKLHF